MPDILGFDVSQHNSGVKPVDWDKIPKDRARFVFIKATEGATFEDPFFDRHWTSAHAHGFVCGAYHFYRSNRTGKEQAANIAKNILHDGSFGKGDLPVAIDVEEFKNVDSKSAASIAAFLKELKVCFDTVAKAMGAKPILYTAQFAWDLLRNPADYLDCPLWIANPSKAAAPVLPKPFKTHVIWQFSFDGKMPGVTGDLDLDRFSGTEADFQKLLLK